MKQRKPVATRQSVLNAIASFDKLGRSAFLSRHGFGESKRYRLRYRGRSYDSKAILGVASKLTARQFSGGAGHTVRVLTALGFQVRDGQRRLAKDADDDLVEQERGAFPFEPWTAGNVDPSCYFASGLNTSANILGFAAIGHDVGAAFLELREGGIRAMESLAGSDVACFVDSGAFSEVEFGAGGPVVVRPLDDDHWQRLFAVGRRLATALGGQLHIVAPDMVGCQRTTLARLARYAPELRELERLGARVLVPVQKGALSQADFWRECLDVLGAGDWIPALPCMKAATTAAEAIEFSRRARPERLHLLGLGTRNKKAAEWFEGIEAASPGCQVSLDSCVLAAHAGADELKSGRKLRRYGLAREIAFGLFGRAKDAAAVATRTAFQCALAFGVTA